MKNIIYALRMLRKNPSITFAAVLSLGLGIGLNTTIFTATSSIILKPLPVDQPDRLMAVYGADEKAGSQLNYLPISYPNFIDYREQNGAFSAMAAWTFVSLDLIEAGEPAQLMGLVVSGNYFDVLGATPLYGRTFLPEED